ncbi:hypothetical protein R5R35_001010 [Gryllus longicercus]|uniref:Uncharacterized protein n=1 Tax=Gryllus longicercus TaxID=2509291 RepID=A0AAN9ZDC9_9ORTH
MRVVMGSRSTPPAAAAAAAPAPPPAHAPRLLAIKKESPDDEIKEYAETAMNELLGWYGYDKVDARDTQGLNLHHFASSAPPAQRSPPQVSSQAEAPGAPPARPPAAAPDASSSASGSANGDSSDAGGSSPGSARRDPAPAPAPAPTPATGSSQTSPPLLAGECALRSLSKQLRALCTNIHSFSALPHPLP